MNCVSINKKKYNTGIKAKVPSKVLNSNAEVNSCT